MKFRNMRFRIVGAVAIIVIAFIGVGSYYAYRSYHKQNISTSSYADARLDPYKGWKTYTLKYEKLTFMYPPSWSIDDTTDWIGPTGVINNPGLDGLAVNGPDSFQISIEAGTPIDSVTLGGVPTVRGADKLTFLEGDSYVVYTSFSPSNNTIDLTYLNASPANTAPQYISKHIMPRAMANGATHGNLVISFGYTGSPNGEDVSKHQSVVEARQDPNYAATKSIIESMHY
jgi:hypothetical protein